MARESETTVGEERRQVAQRAVVEPSREGFSFLAPQNQNQSPLGAWERDFLAPSAPFPQIHSFISLPGEMKNVRRIRAACRLYTPLKPTLGEVIISSLLTATALNGFPIRHEMLMDLLGCT
jgi:hypothetical protein